MKSSAAASDSLAAKLTEFEKALEIVCAEAVSLRGQAARVDKEKEDSNKVLVDVREESAQVLVRLNVVLVSGNRTERLMHFLVTE